MRTPYFKLDRKSLENIYKTFIWPLLEHADVIWDNFTLYEKKKKKKNKKKKKKKQKKNETASIKANTLLQVLKLLKHTFQYTILMYIHVFTQKARAVLCCKS